jgi:hypothetical protein
VTMQGLLQTMQWDLMPPSVGLLHSIFGTNDKREKTVWKSRHPQVFLQNNLSPPPEKLVDVCHSNQWLRANHQVWDFCKHTWVASSRSICLWLHPQYMNIWLAFCSWFEFGLWRHSGGWDRWHGQSIFYFKNHAICIKHTIYSLVSIGVDWPQFCLKLAPEAPKFTKYGTI